MSVQVLAADLATESGMAAVDAVAAERPLGVLVDNAGLAHYMPFLELPPERAEELVKLNACRSSDTRPSSSFHCRRRRARTPHT